MRPTELLAALSAALITFFAAPLALAADAEPPMESVGSGGLIAFLVIFVALIAGYAWMTSRNSKKEAERDKQNTGKA